MKYAILVLATLTPLSARAGEEPPVEVQMTDDDGELYPSPPEKKPARERAEADLEDDGDRAHERLAAKRGRAVEEDDDCHRGPWFWHKPDGANEGDFLLTWRGGGGGPSGAYGGATVEWMFGEKLSMRLGGMWDGVKDEHTYERQKFSGWAYTSGAWSGLDADRLRDAHDGMVGLVEPSLAFHFSPGSKLDVYATAGVSAFIYRLDDTSGGSALLRAGLGGQYFWRALFVGAEVSWYPLELARVTGRLENGEEIYRVERPEDPFDPRRVTFALHAGIRL